MKKKINFYLAATVINFMVASNALAQGVYVNVGGGYGWPAAPNLFSAGNNTSHNDSSSTTYSYERVKGSGSFGKGVLVAGTFGYMCNENVGVELGIGYLFGSKITDKYSRTGNYNSTDESTLQGQMLRLIPALKISAGKGNFKPYIRAGVVIGVACKLKSTEDYNESGFAPYTEQTEGKYSGGTSIGFAGGMGLDYKLSKCIGIYLEASLIAQSWAPKKYVLTKDDVNGVDQLKDMTTSEKETEFVDSYTETYPDPNSNDNSPSKATKIFMPFSSMGVNLGLHISLGGKENK